MPPPKRPANSAATSGTTQLKAWLGALPSAPATTDPPMAHVIELAIQHKECLHKLLNDLEVVSAVDKAHETATQAFGPASALARVTELLVDACWLNKAFKQNLSAASKSTQQAGTRTEKYRELLAASEKAHVLGAQLRPIVGKALTTEHLQARVEAGHPALFVHKRKAWQKRKSPHISALLEALSKELLEEAVILHLRIKNKRQTGSSKRELNPLMDALLSKSVTLGSRSKQGQPAPDFHLVYAIVTSLHPQTSLDISTARKRWKTSQGKLKPKES